MADSRVIVIGGGPGGYVAAIRAAQLGLKPLLIEKEAQLGGTCLHRGCIPTKALLETAAHVASLQDSASFGISLPQDWQPKVDMAKAQERKRGVVRRMAMGLDGLMKKHGVEVLRATAKLIAPHKVQAGEEVYEASHVILAAGSQVSVPKVFPVDGQKVLTSDHILELDHVPESLIVAGSGAVGMEFASLYSALGAKVTIIEMLPRILPLEDEEVSAEVARLMKKKGVQIVTGCLIEKVDTAGEGVKVYGGGQEFTAELLLAAAGRRANLENLWDESVPIATERGRVVVDEYMRTSVPGVYAIGDLIPTAQLAHLASAEGILAAEHIAGLNPQPLLAEQCPAATYCTPQVASVGLTEAKAREKGLEIKVGKFPMAALGKANVMGLTDGFVKIVADGEGKILGMHLLGAHVTDMIAEGVTALRCGATLEDLAHGIHPHPTLAEATMEAAHIALGCPIHFIPLPPRRRRS